MAKSEYKKQYQEQLRQAKEANDDKEKEVRSKDTISAGELESLGYVLDEATVNKMIAIVNDKKQSNEVRALALQKISLQVSDSLELIDWVLSILKDKKQNIKIRISALQLLQQSSFRAEKFAPKRAEYLEVLRAVYSEGKGMLREQAAEILSMNKDEFIQDKLLEGLKSPAAATVAPEKAIQFLSNNIHGDYYPVLRDIVKNPPTTQSKIEAIRVLAADSDSKGLILETLNNLDETKEVRTVSAMAYQSMAPEEFNEVAKKMILDEGENDELRAVCLNALSYQVKAGILPVDEGFTKKLADIQFKPLSDELKEVSAQYLNNIIQQDQK